MKIFKYIQYCLLLSVVFSFSSCLFEDDDIFSESAAQRLNEVKKNAKETLAAAPNGWIMEYFAQSTSGGYTFLMKFDSDGIATVGAQNEYFPNFTTDFGTFDVIGDNGPVLTFNTFNDVFHMFSNPENPSGVGLGGDYEFIIMSISSDLIKLKGKKRGTEIYMRPLSSEYTWESYANKLKEMDEFLFNSNVPRLTFNVGGVKYIAFDGASHVFSLLAEGDDEIVGERTSVPFIVTPTGIRLYKSFETKDGTAEVRYFNLNADNSALVADESSDAYITGPDASSFFTDSLNWVGGRSWRLDKDNLGGEFASVYARILESSKVVFKQEIDYFYFVYSTRQRSHTFSFNVAKATGAFNFEKPVISNNDQVTLYNKGTMDNNAKTCLAKVDGCARLLELLTEGNFTIVPDSPLRPTVLKFVSNNNPNNWFKLILQ